ncbi:MAG: hypothetical protein FD167_1854 [bacterium]|nr:MAG: hypothetical protein FD167_1854 [bacterium]
MSTNTPNQKNQTQVTFVVLLLELVFQIQIVVALVLYLGICFYTCIQSEHIYGA